VLKTRKPVQRSEVVARPATSADRSRQAETICARCGTELATGDAYMDVDGTVCPECQGEAELGEGFRKAFLSVGGTAFGLAGVSFFFNPFAIVSIMSIIAMVATFLYPRRMDEEDRAAVAGYKAPWVLAVLGGLISLAQLVRAVMGLVALFSG